LFPLVLYIHQSCLQDLREKVKFKKKSWLRAQKMPPRQIKDLKTIGREGGERKRKKKKKTN
jgi:hypothetical protein